MPSIVSLRNGGLSTYIICQVCVTLSPGAPPGANQFSFLLPFSHVFGLLRRQPQVQVEHRKKKWTTVTSWFVFFLSWLMRLPSKPALEKHLHCSLTTITPCATRDVGTTGFSMHAVGNRISPRLLLLRLPSTSMSFLPPRLPQLRFKADMGVSSTAFRCTWSGAGSRLARSMLVRHRE